MKPIYPEAKRHLEVQANEAEKGVDVYAGPYGIQCKKRKRYVPINTIFEVKDDSIIPVLVTAGNRMPDIAVLYFDDFVGLVKKAEDK